MFTALKMGLQKRLQKMSCVVRLHENRFTLSDRKVNRKAMSKDSLLITLLMLSSTSNQKTLAGNAPAVPPAQDG